MLLPRMSGLQVLRALREQPQTARIPVIILSTLPQLNEAKLRIEGAAGYYEKSRLLEKKIGESAFLELLERTVQKARERNTATAHSA